MGLKGNRHQLNLDHTIYARQSLKSISAGAFHNDVVCVGSLDTLFVHEDALENIEAVIARIQNPSKNLFQLKTIMVPEMEVSLEDAVKSYLFIAKT